MKLTLHWFLRDLRRHALPLLGWAAVIGVFTWARLWFRLHPWLFIPDRDTRLIAPAIVLGFLETGLLLRVLLDDPARGAGAFWKTRPPSGAAVFGAKLLVVLIVSLLIPLAAEAVFLGIAGPSADGEERLLALLLPPVFALMAGAAASNWRHVMLWLPVSVILLATVFFGMRSVFYRILPLLAEVSGVSLTKRIVYPGSDLRLMVVTALGASLLGAWLVYRRRSVQGGLPMGTMLIPAVAMTGMAITGWYPGNGMNRVPAGVEPGRITCTAVTTPGRPLVFPGEAAMGNPFWSLRPEVTVSGLPGGLAASIYADETVITPDGGGSFPAGGAFMPGGIYVERAGPDGTLTVTLPVTVTAEQAEGLTGKACHFSGTLRMVCYDHHTVHVPLDGAMHEVAAGSLKWNLRVPAPHRPEFYRGFYSPNDAVGQWVETEFVGDGGVPMWGHVFPRTEGWPRLRNGNSGEVFRLQKWEPSVYSRVWEGSGASRERLIPFSRNPEEATRAYAFLDKLCSDPARAAEWVLEWEVFTQSGVIGVPFSVRLAAPQ